MPQDLHRRKMLLSGPLPIAGESQLTALSWACCWMAPLPWPLKGALRHSLRATKGSVQMTTPPPMLWQIPKNSTKKTKSTTHNNPVQPITTKCSGGKSWRPSEDKAPVKPSYIGEGQGGLPKPLPPAPQPAWKDVLSAWAMETLPFPQPCSPGWSRQKQTPATCSQPQVSLWLLLHLILFDPSCLLLTKLCISEFVFMGTWHIRKLNFQSAFKWFTSLCHDS